MYPYLQGLRHGLPIGLGYFSVSFAFGVAAVQAGLSVFTAVMISLTNLTSAGQVAGLSVIVAAGSMVEMAVTQLVINLRYALMSISVSQKLDCSVRTGDRFLMAFGMTDEIFAMASARIEPVKATYFYGLMTLPIICWTGGTLLGAAAGSLLPASVLSALGVAIYGMFIAIILPVAKRNRAVAGISILAAVLACCFAWVPGLDRVSGGFAVIICAVISAAVGALLCPVEETA